MASDSESENGEFETEEEGTIEPNNEGVLEFGSYSEDETSSLNVLFHWQMEDYEVFHLKCNILQIREI